MASALSLSNAFFLSWTSLPEPAERLSLGVWFCRKVVSVERFDAVGVFLLFANGLDGD